MRIGKLWAAARRGHRDERVRGVVICVETARAPPVPDERVAELVARMRMRVLEEQLGSYAGCDRFSKEVRLHLVTDDAQRLAAEVMEVIRSMSLTERVRIRIRGRPSSA